MSELLLRTYTIDDATAGGDGRTLTVRVVPYATPVMVADRDDDTTRGLSRRPYREAWAKGAFRHAVRAPHRVPLIVGAGSDGHRQRDTNPFADVGYAVQLLERDDGLIGDLTVDDSPFGEHTLTKVISGQWRHVSVGAKALRYRDEADPHRGGVRWRTLAALDHVLLTDRPAYTDAQVLAVREQTVDTPNLTRWADKYRRPVAS